MKTALILGVTGQDGAYLAELLLRHGYLVHGTTRDIRQQLTRFRNLGITSRVTMHELSPLDRGALTDVISRTRPDEIYNLSGMTSVAQSFADPDQARLSIAVAQERLLDVVRTIAPHARVYQSASSECFGNVVEGCAANEATPFAPLSPYARAKQTALEATRDSRETHGLHVCSGIVFNHESPLRGEAFVTRKIVSSAAAISRGLSSAKLTLGSTSAARDWGYAPEYVEAMWLMLQQDEPRDLVISTGETHTVAELATAVFDAFGLDAREHVITDDALLREVEIRYSRGDSSAARMYLRWSAQTRFPDLVRLLAAAESASGAGQ